MSTHYTEAVRFFTRELRDQHAAADLVQESYARILARHGAEVENFRALLFRTARNLAIDIYRKAKAEERCLETLGIIGPDCAPSPEKTVSARQQLQRLTNLLAVMPPKRREAFVLVRVYGYSHAEAALHMGSTVGAIEKHMVRAVLDLLPLALAFSPA